MSEPEMRAANLKDEIWERLDKLTTSYGINNPLLKALILDYGAAKFSAGIADVLERLKEKTA